MSAWGPVQPIPSGLISAHTSRAAASVRTLPPPPHLEAHEQALPHVAELPPLPPPPTHTLKRMSSRFSTLRNCTARSSSFLRRSPARSRMPKCWSTTWKGGKGNGLMRWGVKKAAGCQSAGPPPGRGERG